MSNASLADLIPLAEVPSLLPPRRGKPVSLSTLKKWAAHGVGPNRVRLRTFRCGGQVCSTRAALQEFLEALNAQPSETQ